MDGPAFDAAKRRAYVAAMRMRDRSPRSDGIGPMRDNFGAE
jgi:hypothetical protein